LNISPLGARILVRRLETPDRTPGGLYLLGREYPTIGQVEEIGKGSRAKKGWHRIHLPEIYHGSLDLGDFVLFHRDAIRQDQTIEFLGRGLVILDKGQCLGSYRGIKMKTFRPLGDRVLIKPVNPELKSGSIILPDQSVERPQIAEVIAVGEGHYDNRGFLHDLDVKVGDKILYGKFMGSEVKLDGVDHLLILEEDIMAVIHDG
jgi:chaperonin GroES